MAYNEKGAGDVPMRYESRKNTKDAEKWPGKYGGQAGPDGVYDPNSTRDPILYDGNSAEDFEWSGLDRRAGGPTALNVYHDNPQETWDKFKMPGKGKLPNV